MNVFFVVVVCVCVFFTKLQILLFIKSIAQFVVLIQVCIGRPIRVLIQARLKYSGAYEVENAYASSGYGIPGLGINILSNTMVRRLLGPIG